jgi:hypothetical protein
MHLWLPPARQTSKTNGPYLIWTLLSEGWDRNPHSPRLRQMRLRGSHPTRPRARDATWHVVCLSTWLKISFFQTSFPLYVSQGGFSSKNLAIISLKKKCCLCVMGPKMDRLNYLYKGWPQKYQPIYSKSGVRKWRCLRSLVNITTSHLGRGPPLMEEAASRYGLETVQNVEND